MPLVACPDCQTEHSDAAPSCPRCARPAVATRAPEPAATVIEATSKKWKALQVWGVVLILIGTFGCATGAGASPPSVGAMSIGTLAFAGGLGVIIVARVSAWWHHG